MTSALSMQSPRWISNSALTQELLLSFCLTRLNKPRFKLLVFPGWLYILSHLHTLLVHLFWIMLFLKLAFLQQRSWKASRVVKVTLIYRVASAYPEAF